ncbi:hypothetical protein ACS0PU_011368 [Formica fusca]
MPNLSLFDPISQNTYILQVSEEELSKANKDMLFATHLLQKKLNQTQTINESEASTSSYDDNIQHDNEKVRELSDFDEKDGFRWPHEAILLLLSIYQEHEDKMTSGHNITGTQCKSKMAGLKNTYKNVKDHNAKSGNNTRTWRYFNVMDEIFNKKPWMAPIPISSVEDNNNENIPPSMRAKLPIKRKIKHTMLEQMLEENIIARKKMHEEAMARQDKLLDMLGKLLEK